LKQSGILIRTIEGKKGILSGSRSLLLSEDFVVAVVAETED
jgi:hypothetical protein